MKNASSKELAKMVSDNGCKVRFFYERYPAQQPDNETRVFVNYGSFTNAILPRNVTVVGKQLMSNADIKSAGFRAFENGGRVTVRLTTKSGEEVVETAECSILDTFNKETGRRIALGRAIKKLSTEAEIEEA